MQSHESYCAIHMTLSWAKDDLSEVDADVNADGFAENSARGMGHVWNAAASRKFLETTGLKIIIRGHECEPAGYLYNHDRQVLTIFSSPAYSENNDAAVATLDASGLSSLNFLRVNAKNEPVSAAAQLEDGANLRKPEREATECLPRLCLLLRVLAKGWSKEPELRDIAVLELFAGVGAVVSEADGRGFRTAALDSSTDDAMNVLTPVGFL
eukprot:s5515_g1.t1